MSMPTLIAETGWSRQKIDCLSATLQNGSVLRIGNILVSRHAMDVLKESLLVQVENFHRTDSLVAGINREQLRERVRVPVEVFTAALNQVVGQKKLEVAGDLVRMPGRGVAMKDDEADSKKKIEEAFSAAGLRVPALHEVLGSLKVDKARAQKIVTLLLRDKVLLKISDELVFHRGALEDLRRLVAAQKAKSPKMDVATFKELTGVSRKYAIPLLEYLDRERVTRRAGDARVIL